MQLCLMLILLGSTAASADRDLFVRLCTRAQCAGTFARLETFHDAGGRLARIRFRGDFRRCSHPPAIYFDGAGRELDGVDDWLRIDKDSVANSERFHAEMTKGLTLAQEIMCSSVCKERTRETIDSSECMPP
jgi:hypothetical protein